nr:hypothetical protein B0A51_03014 [Rachicladosporium sp. CCFEE 5018]
MDSALLAGRVGVAGLGLGAVSTGIDLVHVIRSALDAWDQFSNAERDVSFFRAKLLLQRAILDSWRSYWYGYRKNGRVSIDELQLLGAHDSTIKTILASVHDELRYLDPVKVLHRAQQSLAASSKVTWIAGQEKVAQDALQRVESLLSGLYRLLPPLSPHAEAQMMMALYDIDQSRMHNNQQRPLPLIQRVAQLRQLNEDLDDELQQRIDTWQTQSKTIADVMAPQPTGLVPEVGTAGTRSRGKGVLVEWKAYAVLQGAHGVELRSRRDNLARLLKARDKPEELLALSGAGYFDDVANKRYGFVFESPARGTDASIVSLNTLLRDARAESLPSLEHRYLIAYRLALSLSILFVVGWLHKGLRSHNILFVKEGEQLQWTQPYLCGFAFSRPDKPNEVSEKLEHSERFNLYRHPMTQNAPRLGYRKAFDIYSFGVILFEIAAWTPAFTRWKHDPIKFREELIKPSDLARVAHWMGSDYRDVMLKCLDGTFEQDGLEVPRMFFPEVVEVLRDLMAQ